MNALFRVLSVSRLFSCISPILTCVHGSSTLVLGGLISTGIIHCIYDT